MININAAYLAHAARVTIGADESLCYVTVDSFKDGALLVATNGHVAVAYYDRMAFIDKGPYFVVAGDDIKKAASKTVTARTAAVLVSRIVTKPHGKNLQGSGK